MMRIVLIPGFVFCVQSVCSLGPRMRFKNNGYDAENEACEEQFAFLLNLIREASVHFYGFLFSLMVMLAVGFGVLCRLCFCLVLLVAQFFRWLFWRCLKC